MSKNKLGLHDTITWHLTDTICSPQKDTEKCNATEPYKWQTGRMEESKYFMIFFTHNYVFKDQKVAVVIYTYSMMHTYCLVNVYFNIHVLSNK